MCNKDFYLNEIDILNWLTNDKYQILRFKDRIEYREDGKLNKIDGPSIEYFSEKKDDLYYLNGKKLLLEEFKIEINKEI